MKKLMTILGVALVMMLTAINSNAQSSNNAYEKAVAEFMEVSNAKATMESTLIQSYQQMGLPISNLQEMVNELLDTIWTKYISAEAKIMQEYYTLDELNEIIAFYKTPVGQKFAANSPAVAQKSAQIMMTQDFMGPMQQVIMKYMR